MEKCRMMVEVPNKCRPGSVHLVPCGQCMPCRIREKHSRIGQIRLHDQQYGDGSTLTLTYEHAPDRLDARHMRAFKKALWKWARANGVEISMSMSLGEHGGRTDRPHWHVLVHGLALPGGLQRLPQWPHGHVYVDTLTTEAISYVTGYLTDKEDPRNIIRYGVNLAKPVCVRMGELFAKRHGFAHHPSAYAIADRRYPLRRNMREWCIKAGEQLGFPRLPDAHHLEGDWRALAHRAKLLLGTTPDHTAWADAYAYDRVRGAFVSHKATRF